MTEPRGETITFDIAAGDEHAELELPRALVAALADETDSAPDVVADIAQFDCTRRAYEMDADETVATESIEHDALALFEDHFGVAFESLIDVEE
ncbi:hypothetical protein C448_06193 [Halococcus morrhuae DSM 1307]|uniref:Uncharacterized protein n=1 Tax=Halococcus morrhuae DSM 1307 TaxID=931277 RepID=M0MLU2_HALMO|nr:hypothetical protein [Halococcus morrhuae]EMA46348.1 hypothetical protein C448_06193 [Halococcus morrhuae DSM 1307]